MRKRRTTLGTAARLSALLGAAVLLSSCATATSGQAPASDVANQQSSASSTLDWKSSTLGISTAQVDGSTVSIDVGAPKDVVLDNSKPLKVAFFNAASTTTYTQAAAKGAQDMAADLGADLTVFDGNWDPNLQLSQIENAINSGEYQAFLVDAVDTTGACSALTVDAPAANIIVVPMIAPLCGHGLDDGAQLWAPGTLSSVYGGGTVAYYAQWAKDVSAALTGPTAILDITGPAGQDPVLAAQKALDDQQKVDPNLQIVDSIYTDWSSAGALTALQNGLLAHPEVKIVLSHYSGLTTGIVQGLTALGRTDVTVYDLGGDSTVKPLIESGSVIQSVPQFPYSAAACGVDILSAAFNGASVPRVALNECRKTADGAAVQTNEVIDKSNVAAWNPEY